MIIHINGWPGAGKKTVGIALAERLNARFVENHLLPDVAIVCAGQDAPDRWALYEAVRSAAYDALKRRPPEETIVMTNALCRNAARERTAWRHVVDLAIARKDPLVPVVLELTPEENIRRLKSEDRAGRKLRDPEILKSFFAQDTLQKPAVPELCLLEVTELSAEAAANAIVDHIGALGPRLSPASLQHMQMLS